MMKDLILHVLECIFCKQQICRRCLDRCVADSETLWNCYLLEKKKKVTVCMGASYPC